MGERIHTTTGNANSSKKKWALIITGAALLILAAGVMLQVTRPTSAFPEDGSRSNANGQAGKSTAGDQGPRKAKPVAVVEKEFITYDELAAECVARHGKDILENLINRKIIQQACDNQGIEISEAEVSREIQRNAEKFNLAVDQWLSMLEAERNVTPMQYRRDIIWPMLALRKLAGEDVKVKKADIQRAFEKNYGPRVEARAIFLDNQRRAQEVWDKAQNNPDDFEELAKQHSIDPASKSMGGKIPPIPRHTGPKELEEAAFKMKKKGQISPVVQVGLSQFVILQYEGRTEPAVTKLTGDIEEILVQELKEEKTQEAVARVFEKLKSEARVTNYVTNVSTGGERRQNGVKTAGGAGTINQTGGTTSKRSSATQIPDAASSAQPTRSSSGKSSGKSATGKAPARSADE
jgi:foldase protein PrsA